MSTISNRFFVTAIDDGSTLHGELRATKSLSQAWNGSGAVPNWTTTTNGTYTNAPIIYLSLLRGSTPVVPNAGSTSWQYNGVSITFSSSGSTKVFAVGETTVSCQGYESIDGRFFVINEYPMDSTHFVPALAIIGNLASSTNPDTDSITLNGAYSIGQTSSIDFSVTANVRISRITSNGYFGQINFVGGKSDITEAGGYVIAYAQLYNQSGSPISNNDFSVRYTLNDAPSTMGSDVTENSTTYQDAIKILESNVIDYATLKCEFLYSVDGTQQVVFTVIEGIDDRQDDEYLYVQRSGLNGNNASLHSGDNPVSFEFFVGTASDATAQTGWAFKIKLYKADAVEITDSVSELSAYNTGITARTDGYYILSTDSTSHKATLNIPYSLVKNKASDFLSGIIYATTT